MSPTTDIETWDEFKSGFPDDAFFFKFHHQFYLLVIYANGCAAILRWLYL